MTIEYVLAAPPTGEYSITTGIELQVVSSGVLGPPGPSGGEGPRGLSALPGTEIDAQLTNGEVVITAVTHWGIDAQGQATYYADSADVPSGDAAYLDPNTLTMVKGLPGQ